MMADNTPFQSFLPFNHLDDSSFNLAVYEFSHGPLSYDADRLETLLFNPVEKPESFNPLSSHLLTCPIVATWLRKICTIE